MEIILTCLLNYININSGMFLPTLYYYNRANVAIYISTFQNRNGSFFACKLIFFVMRSCVANQIRRPPNISNLTASHISTWKVFREGIKGKNFERLMSHPIPKKMAMTLNQDGYIVDEAELIPMELFEEWLDR